MPELDIKSLSQADIQKLTASIQVARTAPPPRGYGKTIPNPPREFPEYEFAPYPKMVLELVTKDYVEKWRHINSYDDGTGRGRSYMGAAPKIGTMNMRFATEHDIEAGFASALNGVVRLESAAHERAWNQYLANPQRYISGETVDAPTVSVRQLVQAGKAEIEDEPTPKPKPKTRRRPAGTVRVKELA